MRRHAEFCAVTLFANTRLGLVSCYRTLLLLRTIQSLHQSSFAPGDENMKDLLASTNRRRRRLGKLQRCCQVTKQSISYSSNIEAVSYDNVKVTERVGKLKR